MGCSGSSSSDLPAPTAAVTTTAIAGNLTFTVNIAGTTAKGGGNVTDQGLSAVTERGLCWNTTVSPTISSSHAADGSGTGVFTNVSMIGLTANTTYYVRAYATNSQGTAYGNEITFNSGWTFGTSYLGGYVFYNTGTGHGLVSAITDQSTGIIWAIVGYQGTSVTGTLETLGSGSANTDKIIAQNGVGSTYAAGLARAYTGGGYTDWFLPSFDELNLMYTKLNVKGVGGFGGIYWSSSEGTVNSAWVQYFNDGYHNSTWKYGTYHVRAVRAF